MGWGGVGCGQGNAERKKNESIPHPTTLSISHIICDNSGIDKIIRSSEWLEWFAKLKCLMVGMVGMTEMVEVVGIFRKSEMLGMVAIV